MRRSFVFLLALVAAPLGAQDALTYQTPAPALAALVDAPRTPAVSLSPDRATMALMDRPGAPSIEELAQPELGLAGVRINPRTTGPSRASGFTGLTLKDVAGARERRVAGFPDGARFRSPQWSPDGRHLAVVVDQPDRVELWTVDAGTATAKRALPSPLNDAAPGPSAVWLPGSDGLVARVVPAGLGDVPPEPLVPAGPVVQQSTGRAAPARTYQDLLASPRDEAVFDHYMTGELVRVSLDGQTTTLAPAGIYTTIDPSPDGRFVLTEAIQRPYSYLVPYYRFPHRIEVRDARTGAVVHTVAEVPLAERVPIAFGSVPTGPRSVGWRADADATLAWAEAQDGGDAGAPADIRDKLVTHAAPFRGTPVDLALFPLRYGGVTWGDDDTAIVEESMWQDRTRRAYVLNPSSGLMRELFTVSFEDRYNDPGRPMTEPTGRGTSVLLLDGDDTFWRGGGASDEGLRPFLRRFDLTTGETEEVFRSAAPYYESPVAFLDDDQTVLLTQRESVTEPPNYVAHDLASGTARAVTAFPHPYPELANVQKETIEYTRADGVPLSATLYLPAGYDAARDGPLPALVWAYPTEFKSADAAGQRSDSPYQFTYVSYWGAVPFVTRGYAVLDDASFPIVGEGDAQPNDTFREQLVMNAEAVIAEGARRGVVDPERVAVGGHSYGAFMVGNLLAHSDLFRAGIARSGAYNRTLTPFGFQREERTFWDDPALYVAMSPFMNAEKIDEPMLMIHGQADNNPGTFTLQSERLYGAIKGLGGTARLVLLPHESHGYQARESLLHMLWEEDRWLDTYVKNAPPREAASASGTGG